MGMRLWLSVNCESRGGLRVVLGTWDARNIRLICIRKFEALAAGCVGFADAVFQQFDAGAALSALDQ